MQLSIVIPAYNESKKILKDLREAKRFLCQKSYRSEVLIIDDGSQDDTAKVVENFVQKQKGLNVTFRLISYPQNRGKGYAVRHGILQSQGKVIAFVDAGLCVPYRFLDKGMEKISQGFDYAIASRRVPESNVRIAQPLYRRLGSKVFSGVVRSLMGVTFVTDTQCGYKVYCAQAAQTIFSKVQTDGFMFDVEALLVARGLGLKVSEFGVAWSNDGDTRYHPVWGTLRNFRELVRIRLRNLPFAQSFNRVASV